MTPARVAVTGLLGFAAGVALASSLRLLAAAGGADLAGVRIAVLVAGLVGVAAVGVVLRRPEFREAPSLWSPAGLRALAGRAELPPVLLIGGFYPLLAVAVVTTLLLPLARG